VVIHESCQFFTGSSLLGFFEITRTSGSLILVFHEIGTGGSLGLMYLEYQNWWLLKIQIGTQPNNIGNTWGTHGEHAWNLLCMPGNRPLVPGFQVVQAEKCPNACLILT